MSLDVRYGQDICGKRRVSCGFELSLKCIRPINLSHIFYSFEMVLQPLARDIIIGSLATGIEPGGRE